MTVRHSIGPARWAAGVGILLFLMALAAGVLFPGQAQAIVDKKHARVYRAYVNTIATTITQDQRAFNATGEDLAEIHGDIKALLSNPPVDHEALLRLEEQAQWVLGQIPTSKILPKQLQDMADTVRTDGLPWFRDDDDKRNLRRATNKIHTGAGLILVAYKHFGEVAGELAKDPPDPDKASEYNKQVAAAVELANPKLKSGLKMLRELQR
jgi:hypothetical protein